MPGNWVVCLGCGRFLRKESKTKEMYCVKSAKYIALALVLALGLIGGAYAYWSDTLAVAGTAETGVLEHQWEKRGHFPNESAQKDSVHHIRSQPAGVVEGDLQVDLINMYPGAEASIYPDIVNIGTIPSQLQSVTVTRTGGSQALFDNIEFRYDAILLKANGDRETIVWYNKDKWIPLNQLADEITNALKGKFVLNPGDRLRFGEETMWFRVNPDAGNNIQGSDVSFKIEFEMVQAVGAQP
jgi:predicted ribosomally synthesized peptide with SipW-like signal peptide